MSVGCLHVSSEVAGPPVDDPAEAYASSSNEAVHLQRRLLSLGSELVTLRNHLHVGGAQLGVGGALPGGALPAALPGRKPQPAVPPRAAPAAPAQPPQQPPPPEPRWRNTLPLPAPPPAPSAPSAGGANSGGDVDDLIHLRGPLTEDAVVRALQARFYHNKFYTWIGPILVSLNGYTDTSNPLTLSAARAACRPELARLVHDAVRHQADTGYPQAIILSGECTPAPAGHHTVRPSYCLVSEHRHPADFEHDHTIIIIIIGYCILTDDYYIGCGF
ncbi:unnamed protein product [Plutella xylostella]|uniref:(diamondback moth) hypothetical protein n=1 Tax=Plutella xylostella TaxID=51655 RepID=A0A8S4CWY4_PLUXY|nr:unnamed protein product [Plutella xylostella]